MAVTVAQAFDAFLRDITPTPYERSAAARHRASVRSALEAAFKVDRFFEIGSFSHGTGISYASDVDVLVDIDQPRPGSSDSALAAVKRALSTAFPRTSVRVCRPAVVVEFADGVESWDVVPGYFNGRGGKWVYDIPGRASGWMESAPEEHADYVDRCNRRHSPGGAKSLARLMKAWSYYCDVPVSSFYLEMRAAQHVARNDPFVPVYDLCWLFEAFHEDGLAAMLDPTKTVGLIHACSTSADTALAYAKVKTAARRSRKALDHYADGDEREAVRLLGLLYNGVFP